MEIRALALPRRLPWIRRQLNLPRPEVFDPLLDQHGSDLRLTLLDSAETFRRPLPRLVEPDPDVTQFFATHAIEVGAPSYVAEFGGAVAWGHPTGGVFTADGRFVPSLTHDPCGSEHHTAWTRWRLPRPRPLPGRTLYLVTPEATDNFHHWMIDLLPRLGLVQRAGYELSRFDHVIVNHAARRYQLETLGRFGIESDRIIAADASVSLRAEQLVVPSLKPHNQSLPAADLAFLRSAFLDGSPPASCQRRLFLSRADASYRRLHNEPALRGWLREHGFEILCPGELRVAEQARLFAEAELIAGPGGAAFANVAFASPSARVIEIVAPQWLSAFHWMISARLGLEHTIVLGDGPVMRNPPDAAARRCDIHLEIAKLTAVLAPAALAAPS